MKRSDVHKEALIAYLMLLGAQNIQQTDINTICVIAGDLTAAQRREQECQSA